MEIQRMLRGKNTGFSAARPAQREERRAAGPARPSTDRLELSRQLVENMEEQRARAQAALLSGGEQKDQDGGILGFMETEEDKLDALSEQLDVQQKCLKIAMNMMQGKRVPPEDERYLMEHDPEGYKLAVSMRGMSKEDDEECESVLDDEDKNGGSASETGESAPEASGTPESGGADTDG